MNDYHQMDVAGEACHSTRSDLLKLAKLADIKQNKAQAMIEQVASVAENFLSVINNYNIEKEILNQVAYGIQTSINRMVNG